MVGQRKTAPVPQTEFDRRFNGMLFGLLSWPQLAEFWLKINPAGGWYLYAIGEPLPDSPASAGHVAMFIREVSILLRRDHDENYCGIVYADNLDHPTLIKIYDPHNLGVSCGSSKNPPLPGWVMSFLPPTEMQPRGIIPANRRRWWQALTETALA